MRKNLNTWTIWIFVTMLPFGVIGQSLSQQVTIHRTEYGVPHIIADNIKADFYAMGYLQLEDYGMRTPTRLLKARGEWALHEKQDPDALSSRLWLDARSRRSYQEAKAKYHLLNQQTKDMLEGFVAGVNRYIRLNPDEFPDWLQPEFTAADVHAAGMGRVSPSTARKFIDILEQWDEEATGPKPVIASAADQSAQMWKKMAMVEEELHPDAGSNVWALAPERTTSGNAVLMRNPHMNWNAGYYEAHIIVPDTLNFYGDFRVGGPLGIVGGFNQYLGWSTTNNYPDTSQWDKVIEITEEIISSGKYTLDPSYRSIFQADNMSSPEIIFAIPYDDIYATEASLHMKHLLPQHRDVLNMQAQPWGGSSANPQFIDTYEEGDNRLEDSWFMGDQLDADTGEVLFTLHKEMPSITDCDFNEGYRLKKYELPVGTKASMNNDFPYFRYTDVLMMKAEALLRTGREADAALLVTEVRMRSFDDPVDAVVTGEELMGDSGFQFGTLDEEGEIDQPGDQTPVAYGRFLDELGWEFLGEARRRTDMIRFGTYQTKNWYNHTPVGDHSTLFPIGISQLNTNPNLTQNPGY